MNQLKKLLAAAVLGVVCAAAAGVLPALAAELNFSGSIDTDGVFSVSGNGNAGYVYVALIRGDEQTVLDSYESLDIGESVLADAAEVGSDGSFAFRLKLPDGEAERPSAERKYTAVIGNTETYTPLDQRILFLYFATDEEIVSALSAVNRAVENGSAENLKTALEENADVLQLNWIFKNAEYRSDRSGVLKIMLDANAKAAFKDSAAVSEAVLKAAGTCALRKADRDTFDSAVKQYGKMLGLNTDQYERNAALAAAMKRCAKTVIAEYGLTLPSDAAEAFRTVEAVAAVNIAARGDVVRTIGAYSDVLGLDVSGLTESEKIAVASKMCVTGEDREYATVSAMKIAYQNAIKPDNTGGNTGGGSIGGSSSGGGSYGNSVPGGVIKTPQNEDKPNADTAPVEIFSDLGDAEWARSYIESLAKSGIVSGKGDKIFDPNSPVMREEFIKMLAGAIKLPESDQKSEFGDVEPNAWYAPFISAAAESGLLNGYDDGRVGIGLPISREEAATLISRAADHENCEITAAAHLNFEDSLDISEFAADAVKRCVGAGMIQGDENNMFRPKASITRAECAKIIFCLINLIS